jgi:hypothetical protein
MILPGERIAKILGSGVIEIFREPKTKTTISSPQQSQTPRKIVEFHDEHHRKPDEQDCD